MKRVKRNSLFIVCAVLVAVPLSSSIQSPISAAAVNNSTLGIKSLISGEITAIDENSKTITAVIFHDKEKAQSEENKSLTVKLSNETDITDGKKDLELKQLRLGDEVEIEYDPTTNKATYIFVYIE